MLTSLELPSLQDRRKNICLTYMYKIVKGLVPAISPGSYLTPRKPGRSIRAKKYTDFNTNNIVNRSVSNNTLSYVVPSHKTDQYKNSFFVRTVLHWNQLDKNIVHSTSVKAFKSALESRD